MASVSIDLGLGPRYIAVSAAGTGTATGAGTVVKAAVVDGSGVATATSTSTGVVPIDPSDQMEGSDQAVAEALLRFVSISDVVMNATAEQRTAENELMDRFRSLGAYVLSTVPASRRRSSALTNLENAARWAGIAIYKPGE